MLQIRGAAICGSVFAVVLLCGTMAYGQNTAGTILGAVSDESGARLPGVTVTITHLDTGIVRSVTTDEGGRYRAPGLGLGNYDVKAELTGFRTAVRMGIQLTVSAEVVVNLTLSVLLADDADACCEPHTKRRRRQRASERHWRGAVGGNHQRDAVRAGR